MKHFEPSKITITPNKSRGLTKTNWLSSFHSFSFGNYYNPKNMNFGALRVLNDDVIAAGAGFPTHPHNNMEIITIVTKGAVTHKDSTGAEGIIKTGEVQVMTAGSGIFHSEKNASKTESLELFQIWISPNQRNLPASYNQTFFGWNKLSSGHLKTLVGPVEEAKKKGWLGINQKATIKTLCLAKNAAHQYKNTYSKNGCYVFVILGTVEINTNNENSNNNEQIKMLNQRDAAEIISDTFLIKNNETESQLLFIEVPL